LFETKNHQEETTMRKSVAVLALLIVGSLALPAYAEDDVEGVKAASQAFYAALNARDAGAMAKVYAHTPSAVHIPPMGSEMAVGWDAVNKSWEDVFTKVAKQINIAFHRTDGPRINGNAAWEVGFEKGPLTFMDGKTADFNLMVTNIYQKTDGHWQLVVHQAAPVQK